MEALLLIDVQNEFSPAGALAVEGHAAALEEIVGRVADARAARRPIAWILHNNPTGGERFVPGSWGAELSPGLKPAANEPVFVKTVFGALTGTELGSWLEKQRADAIELVGFLTHMCVSTTAREALMRGLAVAIDARATGTRAIESSAGSFTADVIHRSALAQLETMGAVIRRAG
ncbi:MAG: cysteine hydrolase family protein [Gaiellaceae bacterium]